MSDFLFEDLTLRESDLRCEGSLREKARYCADRILDSPDWDTLAGRLLITDLAHTLPPAFSQRVEASREYRSPEFCSFVSKHAEFLDRLVDRAGKMSGFRGYFSAATLLESYLLSRRSEGKRIVLELPVDMMMRVAVEAWRRPPLSLEGLETTFTSLIEGYYITASPTLFNAGTSTAQLASCFLMSVGDSLDSITSRWRSTAFISKYGGGLGIDFSQLRHSEIRGVGESSGVVNWIRDFGMILETVNQSGKRKGAGTVFLCDWHVDFPEFLEMRLPTGADEMRSRKLFYAAVLSDLFMKRVAADQRWSLFCPKISPKLYTTFGDEFEEEYLMAETRGEARRTFPARELFTRMMNVQISTGMPFVLYRDAVNRKSNQSSLGVLSSSNLCMEITEHTSDSEIAMCNLASLSLPQFVQPTEEGKRVFLFDLFEEKVEEVVVLLNRIIDSTYYIPEVPEIRKSNLAHRPIGIGVSGLADVFSLLGVGWGEETSLQLEHDIFETLSFAAHRASMKCAKKCSASYSSFPESPISKGVFPWEMWDREAEEFRSFRLEVRKDDRKMSVPFPRGIRTVFPSRYPEGWEALRKAIRTDGIRNSLLIALMPTASTASILGNSESFEPRTSNLYSRTVLAGQFIVVNTFLAKELARLRLWTPETRQHLITSGGSLRGLRAGTPFLQLKVDRLAKLYPTAAEISPSVLLDHAAERSRYVCQSASLNCLMTEPTLTKLGAYHFATWKRGLKTGMYYLRQLPMLLPIGVTESRSEEGCTMCTA